MRIIYGRDVDAALVEACRLAVRDEFMVEHESRVGTTRRAVWPVATVYATPWMHTLRNPARDANPFFHFMEGLWMLAGRNDVAFPVTYNSTFGQFSDDGLTLNAAYGYRWRHHFGRDQLEIAIEMLRRDPTTRRCVVQMWDCTDDQNSASKDVPCNTQIYFSVRNGALDMMVCCRSNDIIWGAYGANAVHMSMLMDYVACAVGVQMGTYTQVSNDWHVYTDRFPVHTLGAFIRAAPLVSIAAGREPLIEDTRNDGLPVQGSACEYARVLFDEENAAFVADPFGDCNFVTPILAFTAAPMADAWRAFKFGDLPGAINAANGIRHARWRPACVEWLERRAAARRARLQGEAR